MTMTDLVTNDADKEVRTISKAEEFRKAQIERRQSEVRPPIPEDITERESIFHNIQESMAIIPPNFPIRFHGCIPMILI